MPSSKADDGHPTRAVSGPARWLPAVAGALAFAVYLVGLAPTVGGGDSAELATVIHGLGVPHPTGYPLFVLIGKGFCTLLAWGDTAWKLHLLCAIYGAFAVGLLAACAVRVGAHPALAAAAALAAGLLPASWHAATTLEVYTLHLLIQAGLLYAWLRWEGKGGRTSPWLLALLLGIGLAHHRMVLLLVPAMGLATLRHTRRWASPGRLLACAVAGLSPLLAYGYLPWAAARNPTVSWGHVVTPRLFWRHVTAADYGGIASLDLDSVPRAWRALVEAGGTEGLALLVLALAGSWFLRRQPRLARILGLALGATLLFPVAYPVVDQATFFLPSLQLAAILAAVGATRAMAGARPGWMLLPLPLVLLALGPARLAHPAGDWQDAHDSSMALLATAPTDALLFTHGPTGFAPLYALAVRGLRPDMQLVDSKLLCLGRYPESLERLRGQALPAGVDPELLTARTAVATGRPVVLLEGLSDLDWNAAGLERVDAGSHHRLVPMRKAADQGSAPSAPPTLLELTVEPGTTGPGSLASLTAHWSLPAGQVEPGLRLVAALGDEQGPLLADNGDLLVLLARVV